MSWDHLLAFNAILIAALLSPGPAFLFSAKTSVSSGRRSGVFGGIGLATMAAFWTLAALMGLNIIFDLFPWAFTALKLGGAAYLIWIAVQTWRQANAPLSELQAPSGRAFAAGVLINLGNPKSVLFAAAVIIAVFPQTLSAGNIAVIVFNHFVLEAVFYTVVAVVLSTPAARHGYMRLKPMFDRIAALFLGAFGLRLLLEK
jgi:threonine/homoserine/homoserine lactone efflux protein